MTGSIPKTFSSQDSSIDSNVPKSSTLSTSQFGFLAMLPSDVLLGIFAYLTKNDCLTCMAVCRDWYLTIPQYAQGAWEALLLNAHDTKMENQRRIRCLGNHVKRVTLDKLENEISLYHVMHKLLDWGCTKIESLELNECQTDDQDTFLEVLTKLAPHLTHLKMLGHRSNIAFSHIFNACPELTHFTYQLKVDDWEASGVFDTEPVVHEPKEPRFMNRPTKITHLCLDVIMNKDTRLYPILRRCPNLRCFVGPSLYARFDNSETWQYELVWDYNPAPENLPWWDYNRISVNLDYLFKICPNINYLQPYYTYQEIDELGDIDGYTDNANCAGLRYLSICEDYGGAQVSRYVTKNQSTLEYLLIREVIRYDVDLLFQWSPVFLSLQLPQLRTLYFDQPLRDTASIVVLLNHCPVLEELYLFCGGQLEFDPQTLGSLSALHRLRSLTCPYIHIDGLCFMMLLNACPALEELSLDSPFIPFNLSSYPFNGLSRLKHLHLSHVRWTDIDNVLDKDEAFASAIQHITAPSKLETLNLFWVQHFGPKSLLEVAEISTLKTCSLKLNQEHYHSDVLRKFVEKRPSIEVLAFQSHGDLPLGVLATLRKLPLLKELFVSAYNDNNSQCKFDGSDMLQLLRDSKMTGVYLQNLIMRKYEQTPFHNHILKLVEQEAPQYCVLNDSEQKNFPFEKKPRLIIFDTVIKRRIKK